MTSLQRVPQTVLLIGGMFGSGKSTLASVIQETYGPKCYNIDFANIYGDIGGVALSQSKEGDSFRDSIWGSTVNSAIDEKINEGYELVVANSSFLISERRRMVMDRISDTVNTVALIMALPQLMLYRRIKEGRPVGSHPVNQENARESIVKMNRKFISGDNSDLLLPSVVDSLPPEYLAMLCKNEANRHILSSSREGEVRRASKWVVVPYNLTADLCIELVNLRISDPFLIRSYLEGKRRMDAEGNGKGRIEYE